MFILVATDIASRGIDVEDITHVFNFDLPNEPEVYIHRIGRTARAGREGLAYSFCDETESGYLVGIQQLLGEDIEVLEEQPYHFEKARPKPGQKPGRVKGAPAGGVRVVVPVGAATCAATTEEGRTPTIAAAREVNETAAEDDRTVAENRPTASLVKRATAPTVRQVAGHPNPTSAAESNKAGPTLPTETVQTAQIVPIDGSLAGTTGHDVAAET